MSDLIKPIDLGNRNLMGLRPAQASLYKYLKKCSDEKTTVQLEDVIKIYFLQVRGANYAICGHCGPGSEYRNVCNKDYLTMKGKSNYSYFVEQPARHWMQNTVGSLVMRGLLTIIPNFDIKITEDEHAIPT